MTGFNPETHSLIAWSFPSCNKNLMEDKVYLSLIRALVGSLSRFDDQLAESSFFQDCCLSINMIAIGAQPQNRVSANLVAEIALYIV